MKAVRPDLEFERVLMALERDLISAADEEILAAAEELGMNPTMKGSAAFFGVTLLVQPTRGTLSLSASEDVGKQDVIRHRRRPKGNPPTST